MSSSKSNEIAFIGVPSQTTCVIAPALVPLSATLGAGVTEIAPDKLTSAHPLPVVVTV